MKTFWFIDHLAMIFAFLLAVVAFAHMIRQRRSSAASVAWLLAIVLLPYVGVFLYLMLGGRKMGRLAGEKTNIGLSSAPEEMLSKKTPFSRLLRASGIPSATAGNHLVFCTVGEDSYEQLVSLIEGATESIYITTFILHPDEVGKDIVSRLARRASEGVIVRVLLDGVGSLYTTRRFLTPLTAAGGKTAFFIPMIHRPFRGRTNLRNHRKIVIVDEKQVMAGGANIASEYIGPTPRADRWCDLSFVLKGPAVSSYQEIFYSDWEFASGETLRAANLATRPSTIAQGTAVVQPVASGPDVPEDALYDVILSAAFEAEERLWVATPYFVPDEALLRALMLATHRGTDVRILIPEKSNHPMADLARGTYLREIQAAGGNILLYSKGMMHAKVMIMDKKMAMVGSANMDMRSLLLNYEVALFVYSEKEISAVETWMENLAVDTRTGVEEIGALRDLCEGVVRMMAPLL